MRATLPVSPQDGAGSQTRLRWFVELGDLDEWMQHRDFRAAVSWWRSHATDSVPATDKDDNGQCEQHTRPARFHSAPGDVPVARGSARTPARRQYENTSGQCKWKISLA